MSQEKKLKLHGEAGIQSKDETQEQTREAVHVKAGGDAAVCRACPHRCRLRPGQTGLCGARENREGKIVSQNYGKLTALALDPIEKKPLVRFFPGSHILSVGSYGCNLKCPFCQNYEISMEWRNREQLSCCRPEELAAKANELKYMGNIGVAFTYNEPLIGWEFVRDTAMMVRELGMKNVLVTNGFASKATRDILLPYIDAVNVDLKGFTDEYYRKLGGSLQPVKDFITEAAAVSHVELTTLIVPGENDSEEEIDAMSSWIASINREIPYHLSRFFPRYHMADREPTEIRTVYRLAKIAERHLKYVYTGNC